MNTRVPAKSNKQRSQKASAVAIRSLFSVAILATLAGCAGGILKYENSAKVLENKEFDSAIRVKEIPDLNEAATPMSPIAASDTTAKTSGEASSRVSGATAGVASGVTSGTTKQTAKPRPAPKPKPTPKPKPGAALAVEASPKPRQPVWEDSEGFVNRRPIKDPYRVGEEVVLDISYWALDAGELTMQTRPFVEVNGRKAYRFHAIAKTVSVFESFYKVNDYAETLVDFETLLPVSYTLDVKESKQLRDARAVHDLSAGQPGKMQFWDKKITKDYGIEERKMEWEMLPYSQNIFSALWYLRAFKLTPGKKIRFNLAHENENITIICEVLRREKLSTQVGELDTIVIRPSAEKDGQPKNIGQNLFWLTDDDSKLMVRMETKIKIGSIVGSLQKLKRQN